MSGSTYPLRLVRGKTCEQALLYSGSRLVYRPITAVLSLAPLRLTVPLHGCPENWPIRVQGVTAPTELNTPQNQAWQATVVDANTLEINSLDGSLWSAYVPSGHVVFQEPVDLTGWKARMQIRTKAGGTVLLTLSSDPADNAEGEIEIDVPGSALVIKLSAAQTAALSWNGGVYDLEGIRPDGAVVSILAPSTVVVGQEVTVWP